MTSQYSVSEGWKWTPLSQVAEVIPGQSPPGSSYNSNGEGLPFFQGKAEFGSLHPTTVKWCTEPRRIAQPGDVLISVRAPVGPTNLADQECAIGRGLAAIRARDGVPSRYLLYALRATVHELKQRATGTTFEAVSGADVRSHMIPLAPEIERPRIVAAIEEQLSRLDVAVGSLIHARANLVRYREAVISVALSGANATALLGKESTGQDLMEAVRRARKQRWVDDRGLGAYREPASPVGQADLQLPHTWGIASLEQLTDPIRTISYGILMPKEDVPNGVPYVRVKDIRVNRIDLSNLRRTSAEIAAAYRRSSLRSGDILIAIRGSYGRVAEVPQELEGGNITQDTARLDVSPLVDRRYVAAYLRGPIAQRYLRRVARGVAVKGVNIGDLRALPVPVPPLADQVHIVAEIDRELTVLDELAAEVLAASARSTSLRSSILRAAFSGRLPLTPVGSDD